LRQALSFGLLACHLALISFHFSINFTRDGLAAGAVDTAGAVPAPGGFVDCAEAP